MNNTIITNDTNTSTLITIKLDNKNINHAALNRFLKELEDLSSKYSIISAKDGVMYGR